MAPHSQCHHMQQSARMCNKTVSLKQKNIQLLRFILPSCHDAVWFVCVCANRINLPTQNIMLTILNALSLACAKSSICSMQVGFCMALAGVPVRELFDNVGYWRRTRVPCARQWAESAKEVIREKHLR